MSGGIFLPRYAPAFLYESDIKIHYVLMMFSLENKDTY